MANHEIVPGSAFTSGTAERRKSATSFSLPGFACNGTYRANLVIDHSFYRTRGQHECQKQANHMAAFACIFRSVCARACQLFVRTPFATTCKHQVEEDKAEQDGQLTSVDRREETLRRMSHEVSNRHITRENESDWAGEKPD